MACPRRNSSIAQSPLLRPPLPAMMLPVGGSMTSDQNRRKFLGNAAATAAAFTIVPRHVLGGPGVVAPSDKIKGVSSYTDYRELLDKEKDLNAVKIMTPDHLHGVISIAAMKKGKHAIMHKPIANRLKEARMVIDTARERGVATHFMPWDA